MGSFFNITRKIGVFLERDENSFLSLIFVKRPKPKLGYVIRRTRMESCPTDKTPVPQ